jgi:hypothetical protein
MSWIPARSRWAGRGGPAATGLPPQQWDALIGVLMTLHDQQRETGLEKRRGHRPRLKARASAAGPSCPGRPGPDHRPPPAPCPAAGPTIAVLFGVRPETIKKRIRDIRQLLDQAGYTIQPGPHRLASLEDLSNLAAAEGILTPAQIKTKY